MKQELMADRAEQEANADEMIQMLAKGMKTIREKTPGRKIISIELSAEAADKFIAEALKRKEQL